MVDVFNALNSTTATNRNDRYHGTFYKDADPSLNKYVPDPHTYELNKILNPRVMRLGVRFTF